MNNRSKQIAIAAAIVAVCVAIGIGIYFATKDTKTQDTTTQGTKTQGTKTTTETPGITIDGVDINASKQGDTNIEGYRMERYDMGELSESVKISISWTNDDNWNDVTNLYFKRTHGNLVQEVEASEAQRQNDSSHNIILEPLPGENMVGTHTIDILYKVTGDSAKKTLTTVDTTITQDQITLALDSLEPTPLEFSVPDFSTTVSVMATTTTKMVNIDPNPTGFGPLMFIPAGTNGINIKRTGDNKFLTVNNSYQATWTNNLSDAGTFYLGFFDTINKYRIAMDNSHNNNTRYLIISKPPQFKKKKDIKLTDTNLFTITEIGQGPDICISNYDNGIPGRMTALNTFTGRRNTYGEIKHEFRNNPNDLAFIQRFMEEYYGEILPDEARTLGTQTYRDMATFRANKCM